MIGEYGIFIPFHMEIYRKT